MQTLHEKMLEAIDQFERSVNIPILLAHPSGKLIPHGTGTLFQAAGRLFLVTARHLFEDGVRSEDFVIPASPAGDSSPRTLGNFTYVLPDDGQIDIAILEFQDREDIERLTAGWRVLTLENTGTASSSGIFCICGYPGDAADIGDQHTVGRPMTIYVERIDVPKNAKPPITPDLDLFFNHHNAPTGFEGQPVQSVALGGMSGASVWEIDRSDEKLWLPENKVTIVGVQAAFSPGSYVRAKSWKYVLGLLAKFDAEMNEVVTNFVDERQAAAKSKDTGGDNGSA